MSYRQHLALILGQRQRQRPAIIWPVASSVLRKMGQLPPPPAVIYVK